MLPNSPAVPVRWAKDDAVRVPPLLSIFPFTCRVVPGGGAGKVLFWYRTYWGYRCIKKKPYITWPMSGQGPGRAIIMIIIIIVTTFITIQRKGRGKRRC